MKDVKTFEELATNGIFIEAPLGKVPDWLIGKKVSPRVLRVMMVLFFIAVGFSAVSAYVGNTKLNSLNCAYAAIEVLILLTGFFLNQLIFVPRFYFNKRKKFFVFCNFLVVLGSATLRDLIILISGRNEELFWNSLLKDGNVWIAIKILLIFVVITVIMSSFNVLVRLGGISAQQLYLKRVQENFFLQADLAFLKQQLSSHFLFNTLNNIAALMDIDPKQAQKSIMRLSSLLRQILHETKENKVVLEMEIDILQKYCELEKLRFGSNMDFSFEVHVENPTRQITPLLLMPLVENAVKYGVHPSKPCRIAILIEEKSNELHCRVENSVEAQTASMHVKSGIGLANLKRRLELCYPEKYQYSAEKVGDEYIADLKISFSDSVESQAGA